LTKHGGSRAEIAPAGTNWNKVYEHLVAYATGHHRLTLEDAEQVAQEALRRFFDPTYALYEPATHGDILRYLGSLVNGIVVNQYRRHASAADWFVGAGGPRESEGSPEDYAIAAEHAHLVLEKLMDRTARDPLAQQLLRVTLDGVHGAAEQAKCLGVPVEHVYQARRRVKAYISAVLSLMGGS
jgi:DNA-directed RNA polymerase specialized sigma24 family protein